MTLTSISSSFPAECMMIQAHLGLLSYCERQLKIKAFPMLPGTQYAHDCLNTIFIHFYNSNTLAVSDNVH